MPTIVVAIALGVTGCHTPTASDSTRSPRHPHPIRSSPATELVQHVAASVPRLGVHPVSRHELGASWHRGCPVAPSQLRALTVRYWGFNRRTDVGTLVVNVDAVHTIRVAMASLRRARFPIRHMDPISRWHGDDNRSMRHDNTSAFNCRYAVSDGPKAWSEHAYGEAIDIDPLENPYRLDGKILPRAGAPFVDRSRVRRGMITATSPAVAVFDRLGWGWGGRWSSTPDYQHFSVNGR